MPMLFVRCHSCQQPFPSGIAPDASLKAHLELVNVLEQCPKCGATERYATHEFFIPAAEPEQADRPLDPSVGLPTAAETEHAAAEDPEPPHDRGPPVGNRNRPVNVSP